MKRNFLLSVLLLLTASALIAKPSSPSGSTPLSFGLFTPVQAPAPEYDCIGLRINLLAGHVYGNYGLTIGPINITDQENLGFTLGLVNLDFGYTAGVQWGLVSRTAGHFDGFQSNLVSLVGGDFKGLQGGLFFAKVAGELEGVSLGLVSVTDETRGFQASLINVAQEVHGLQLGLVNFTRVMSGCQIGVFNVITDSPVPFFPILNLYIP